MQEPRRFRHRRLRAWAQNKNVDFGSETVNYEVTNNTWSQLPKANQKLGPSLGPNFQYPIRNWAQASPRAWAQPGVGPNDRLWAQPPLANQMWSQLG